MRLLIIALCLTAPALLRAADIPGEECDFDQQERSQLMLELQKKYPGSRYDEKDYSLEIPRGKDMVHLGIGGCVHYGVMIEFQTNDSGSYDNEQALMALVLALVKEYSQGQLDHDKLRALVTAKQWNRPEPGIYFLNYEEFSVTQIYWHLDDDKMVLGIYSYN